MMTIDDLKIENKKLSDKLEFYRRNVSELLNLHQPIEQKNRKLRAKVFYANPDERLLIEFIETQKPEMLQKLLKGTYSRAELLSKVETIRSLIGSSMSGYKPEEQQRLRSSLGVWSQALRRKARNFHPAA